ncbi:MAG: lipocalin family protein [Treponema sp.]|nr:lipocalin family protein [Treponema sp.]
MHVTKAGSFVAVLLFAGGLGLRAEGLPPLELVPRVDPARYAGLWYEIARFQQAFEKDLVGVTAEYSIRKDGRIAVKNSGFKKTLDGPFTDAKAVAWVPDPAKPAALKVQFFWPFAADYLIFGLDDQDYSWALVGDNSRKYLWFLSRTPSIDQSTFDKMAGLARAQGYDLSKLFIVPQKEGN